MQPKISPSDRHISSRQHDSRESCSQQERNDINSHKRKISAPEDDDGISDHSDLEDNKYHLYTSLNDDEHDETGMEEEYMDRENEEAKDGIINPQNVISMSLHKTCCIYYTLCKLLLHHMYSFSL